MQRLGNGPGCRRCHLLGSVRDRSVSCCLGHCLFHLQGDCTLAHAGLHLNHYVKRHLTASSDGTVKAKFLVPCVQTGASRPDADLPAWPRARCVYPPTLDDHAFIRHAAARATGSPWSSWAPPGSTFLWPTVWPGCGPSMPMTPPVTVVGIRCDIPPDLMGDAAETARWALIQAAVGTGYRRSGRRGVQQ